jgi:glycerophosphoryl diester phosphodiesterase
MWRRAFEIIKASFRDFAKSWKALAATSLVYRLIAFALLAPATALILKWLLSRTGSKVVADTDIAQFFLITPVGLVTIVLGGALLGTITALEVTCLMTIGLTAARGDAILPRTALAFGAKRAQAVLRLFGHMVVRLFIGLIPFVILLGGDYFVLLRHYDINFYLTEKPPALWAAAAIGGAVAIALIALLIRTYLRWSMALPLVLYEGVHPAKALGASAKRVKGHRPVIAIVLVSWVIVAEGLGLAVTTLMRLLGRTVVPLLGGSLPFLLFFLTVLLVLWAALALAASVFQSSFAALALARIYQGTGPQGELRLSKISEEEERRGLLHKLTPRTLAGVAAIGVLAAVGVVLLMFLVTRTQRPVSVIAHRGASAEAPENTLAAFRLAIAQEADFIELDVQESADGEVVVVHDSDLMKLGGPPRKIWELTAAELKAVDIGSRVDPKYAGEGVPTLAEVLAVARGRVGVVVELKSYGHNDRLEEKVAVLVEAAGMEKACLFMSLDHAMVAKMKRLRPDWRVGLLAAKTLGDILTVPSDFLAVEAGMANARFVRKAHRAGRDVYVWTVNDPAPILLAMSVGVDGLISDRPALARLAVTRRAELSDAQRFFVAIMVRLGTRIEVIAAEVRP